MIGSIGSYNSALVLLRSGTELNKGKVSDVDALIEIVQQADRQGKLPVSADKTATEKSDEEKADPEVEDSDLTPSTPYGTPAYLVFGTPLYGAFKSPDEGYGAEFIFTAAEGVSDIRLLHGIHYGFEDVLAPETATHGSKVNFSANVVIATTLEPAENEAWNNERNAAIDKIATAVGAVLDHNTPFHVLSQINPSEANGDLEHILHVNNRITHHNMIAIGGSGGGYRGIAEFYPHIRYLENNEMKLNAFQIKSENGRVLAELTDEGHLVTYNRDGSQDEVFNRAQLGYKAAKIVRNPDFRVDAEYIVLASHYMSDDQLNFY